MLIWLIYKASHKLLISTDLTICNQWLVYIDISDGEIWNQIVTTKLRVNLNSLKNASEQKDKHALWSYGNHTVFFLQKVH